ncbi:MAG TPA: ABC transporter ATP-binding protein [Solirubrobacterales bacterium]|nr:ABC transporter ATP-binding protein [Solirubrobacterales bacterium]
MSGLEVRACDRLRELELDVELQVDGNRCAAIVGPSGAGKSTVLRIIAGLRRPNPGRVVMGGEVWLDTGQGIDLRPEKRACGFMFQDYALFPHLSAWRNVAFGMPGPRQDRRGRALEQLRRFSVERLADVRPASLSGGERQRVALARSLARDPSVLLLDEPLAALDTRTRAHAGRELVAALRGTRALAIVVTHDFSEAAMLADEIFVMDAGRVVQRGTAAELSARPASAFVADFAGSVVLSGTAQPEADGLTKVDLDGGGVLHSTDLIRGPVGALVFPWEISLEPGGAAHESSALNRLEVEVISVTEIGNRARVGLSSPQPLVAEVTVESNRSLALRPGVRVTATWKATATRLVAR